MLSHVELPPAPAPESLKPTVYVVDDDAAITALLTRVVESAGMRARAFNRAQDFLAHYDASENACLLTDVNMPGMTGLELLQRLRDEHKTLPVILITGYGNIPMCVEAMRSGAFEFLQKPFSPSQVKEIVLQAIEFDRSQRTSGTQLHDVHARLNSLSPEEHATLQMLLSGSMNKHIASALDVSRRTVQYRISSVLQKMGVKTRGQLISLVAASKHAVA